MFKKLFGKEYKVEKSIEVYEPISGEDVKIEDIADPVFAKKMMGDGFGINKREGVVGAPIKGKVKKIFPNKHALGLKEENGLE
ncbi:PTS glucose transporter subunit IIA, partial [Staphylococcus simulans]